MKLTLVLLVCACANRALAPSPPCPRAAGAYASIGGAVALSAVTFSRVSAALGAQDRAEALLAMPVLPPNQSNELMYQQALDDRSAARSSAVIAGVGAIAAAGVGTALLLLTPHKEKWLVDASFGIGGVHGVIEQGLPGPSINLGIGGFVTPQLAITTRVAGANFITGEDRVFNGTVGPNAQLWFSDHGWAGLGVGLGFAYEQRPGHALRTGLGFDLRGGYSFDGLSSISLEATMLDGFSTVAFLYGYAFGASHPTITARPSDPRAKP